MLGRVGEQVTGNEGSPRKKSVFPREPKGRRRAFVAERCKATDTDIDGT